MVPRRGYKSLYHDMSRYKFLYPDREGYENWKWTNFDIELIQHLEIALGDSVFAGHINQPKQVGKPFFENTLKNIFSDGLFYKDIKRGDINEGWWYRFIDRAFSSRNKDRFFYAKLDNINKSEFFKTRDIGCFWYIVSIEKGFEEKLIDLIDEKNVNDDGFITDSPIKYILYRDYLGNSTSIALKRQYVSIVDEFIGDKRIFMCDSELHNIFDTSYIDDLASEHISY